MSNLAFSTSRLSIKTRRERKLDQLSVSGRQGMSIGIASLPAAGARALVRVIAGAVKPSSGHLEVLGGNPRSMRVRSRIGVSLSPEHLDDDRSVNPFLQEVARMKGLSHAIAELEVRDLIAELGLHGLSDCRIGELQATARLLLCIACAFFGNPELIVLTEDPSMLPSIAQAPLLRRMRKHIQQGATVTVALETVGTFGASCDELILLSRGRLIGQATPERIRESITGMDMPGSTSFRRQEGRSEPPEPSLAEICQWVLEHPDEIAARAKRWNEPR